MTLAYILAFITFLGWGTGDLFTIYAARKIGASLAVFWIFAYNMLFLLLVLPFAPHNIHLITLPLLILNIILGLFFIAGNALVTEAFSRSSAPLVGIIVQVFPALVLVLSTLVYKDKITSTQIIYISIIFIGVFLCSVDLKKLLKTEKIFDFGTILALIGMVCLAIFFTFTRILVNSYGWFLPIFIANALFPIIYFNLKLQKQKFIVPKKIKIIIAMFMVGVLIRSGDIALNYGLSIPGASHIVAPIAGASPILFVTMSFLIYKDPLTKQQLIGIGITLIGLLLLSFFGGTV